MKPEDSDDYSETNESIKDAGFIQNVRSNSSPFINSPHLTGSLTSLDLASHRRIIKVVTVFSIIFFIVCFVMIITTLKYSQYVDEKSELCANVNSDKC